MNKENLSINMENRGKKFKKRNRFTIEEKIAIIKEYLDNVGGEIQKGTIYKGIDIGRIIKNLKYQIISGRKTYDEKVIDFLNEHGLLDRKKETLDESYVVELIKEYIADNKKPIDGSTVYKDLPIGKILIRIRHELLNGKGNYSDETIEFLKNNGLLERQKELIVDKIERLEKYCIANPKLWHMRKLLVREYEEIKKLYLQDSEDYSEVEKALLFIFASYKIEPTLIEYKNEDTDFFAIAAMEELKKVIDDYEYIRIRKSRKKLEPEYALRLKKAGVGRVFGEKDDIQELSQKSGIEIKLLNKINSEFGSIDEFREIYIELLINFKYWQRDLKKFKGLTEEETKYIESIFGSIEKYLVFKEIFNELANSGKIITSFDIRGGAFIASKKDSRLAYLLDGEQTAGKILDRFSIDTLLANLLEREKERIEELTSDSKKVPRRIMATKYNISIERVRQIEAEAMKKLLAADGSKAILAQITPERRREFIERYFIEKDIFITPESFILDHKLSVKLYDIIYNGLQEAKENNANFSINEIGLSEEAVAILREAEYVIIKDILDTFKNPQDIFKIRKMERKYYEEIIDKIHSLELSFESEKAPTEAEESQEDKKQFEYEEYSIGFLNLHPRIHAALIASEYYTIGDILSRFKKPEDMKVIKGLGSVGSIELVDKIHTIGMKFESEIEFEREYGIKSVDVDENAVDNSFSIGEAEQQLKKIKDEKLKMLIKSLIDKYERLQKEIKRCERIKQDLIKRLERLKERKQITSKQFEELKSSILRNIDGVTKQIDDCKMKQSLIKRELKSLKEEKE